MPVTRISASVDCRCSSALPGGWAQAVGLDRTGFVDRLPMTLMMRPSVPPTGNWIGSPVSVTSAAHQTFGDVHRDGADGRFTEMLCDFEHQAVTAVLVSKRVQNRRKVAFELHVDHGARSGNATDLLAAVAMTVLLRNLP